MGGPNKPSDPLGDQANQASNASKTYQDAIQANVDALNAWDTETSESIKGQRGLIATLKDEVQQIKNSAQEIGSLKSQLTDITGATKNYTDQLSRQISVSNQYNVLLKEMREGQADFSKSLLASTSKIGTASKESQKHIDALHDGYYKAKVRAAEYGLEVDALTQHTRGVHAAFTAQIGAMGQHGKALDSVAKDTFLFSRFMGTTYQESIQLVNERMEGSTKTLSQVQEELMVVAREADNWTKKLESMGKEAQATGNVTRVGFLNVLKEIQGEFRGGMYAAEGFAKSTGALLDMAKKAGFTPNEAKAMASGFGKFIKELGGAQSIFGIRVAQQIGGMLKDLDQIQDAALKKRLEPYAKKVISGQQLNIVDLQAIVGATQGSAEGIKMLIKGFADSGINPDVMRSILGQSFGPGQQHIADKMTEFIQSGQAEKAFDLVAKDGSKAEKDRKKQMDFWKKDLEQLMKEGATATKVQYQIAKEVYEMKTKVLAWMGKYPVMMIGVMMAAQAGGKIAGAGVQAIGARMGGRFGGLLAGLGGGGAGAAGATTAGATTAGATTGGVGTAGAIGASTAAWVLGPILAAAAGLYAGHKLDKYVGEKLAGGDDSTRRMMGKDKSLSGWLGAKGLPTLFGTDSKGLKEIRENVSRIPGVFTEAHAKELKKLDEQVKWAEKNYKKLDSNGKKQLKEWNQRRSDLTKHKQTFSYTPEAAKAEDVKRRKIGLNNLTESWDIFSNIMTDKSFESADAMSTMVNKMVMAMGPTLKAFRDPAAIMKHLEKIGALDALTAGGKFSKKDIAKMVARTMLSNRVVGADAGYEESASKRRQMTAEAARVRMSAGGKDMDPHTMRAAKTLLKEEQTRRTSASQKMTLEVLGQGGGGGEKEATRGPDGSVILHGTTTTSVKVTRTAGTMIAASRQAGKPKGKTG